MKIKPFISDYFVDSMLYKINTQKKGLLINNKISNKNNNVLKISSSKFSLLSQSTKKRLFSSYSSSNNNINPYFITGLVDGEGSFTIKIVPNKKLKLGYQIQPIFQLNMHIRDSNLLLLMKKFYGDRGFIYENSKLNTVEYRLAKFEDLLNIVIPHFNNYPLQTSKLIDYELWKECLILMAKKEHLTDLGLEKIISIKGAINRGLPNSIKEAFPNIVERSRPEYSIAEEPLNPYWVSGFIEAESCFFAGFEKSGQLRINFIIGLNERDKPILIKMKSYFEEIGKIYALSSNNAYQYKVSQKQNINNVIIKHFDLYPLIGNKLINYNIWREIFNMYLNKHHLTPEGKNQIKLLIEKLNI